MALPLVLGCCRSSPDTQARSREASSLQSLPRSVWRVDGSCHHLNSSQPPQPSWWPRGGQPGFKGPKCPGDLQPPLWFRRNLDNKQGSCLGAERLCTTIPGPAPFQPQEGAQGTPGAMGQSEKGWMSTLMHPLHLKKKSMDPQSRCNGSRDSFTPWQGSGWQAWAAVSVTRGRSGYNTGMVSGSKREGAASPCHAVPWDSCQNASSLCRGCLCWGSCPGDLVP